MSKQSKKKAVVTETAAESRRRSLERLASPLNPTLRRNVAIFERMKRIFPEGGDDVLNGMYQHSVWSLLDLIEDIDAKGGRSVWPASTLNGYFDGIRDALSIPRKTRGAA